MAAAAVMAGIGGWLVWDSGAGGSGRVEALVVLPIEDLSGTDKVFVVAVGPEGRVWFGHQELGLGFLDGDRPRYLTTADGLIHDEVWDLEADHRGRMWISTQGGLCSYGDQIWACFDITSGLNNERLWPLHVAEDWATSTT